MPQPDSQFDHKPARVKERLLLQSICARCGESKIVSAADGSLAAWEDGHVCTGAKLPLRKAPQAQAVRSGRRLGNE